MRPTVTVAALVYRDPAWISFLLEGLAWSRNHTPYTTLIVGNDAESAVMETGRVDVDHRNADPAEHYLARVYRAWNRSVEEAQTELVCLMNDDMRMSDYWLDELVDLKVAQPDTIPCSLLVESGRIPSAMPEHVRNFGVTPESFDDEGFRTHAEAIRKRGQYESGRLYMPCLFTKAEFAKAGGYPIGNPPGITGDKHLFAQFAGNGSRHLTCLGSIVAHVQEGARRG